MKRIAELLAQLYWGQVRIWESDLPEEMQEAGISAARDAINVRRSEKLSAREKAKALSLGLEAQEAALRNDAKALRQIHAEIKEFDL